MPYSFHPEYTLLLLKLYGERHFSHLTDVCPNQNGLPEQELVGLYSSMGDNLISCKSKKQNVVERSSSEAEYRVMALATCELTWLKHIDN